jgi:Trypsin
MQLNSSLAVDASAHNFSKPTSIIPFLDPTTSPMFGMPLIFDVETLDMMARIVGGNTADPTEAPFFTLLITWDESEGVWKNMGCGGAVVSNRHVLTAAHCFSGRSGKIDAVFINAYDPFRGNPTVPFHFSRIKSYTIHPDFDDRTNVNDVVIITLKRRIKDTVSFPPVRLLHPQQGVVDGQETTIYGFGKRMDNDTAPVETLRSVSIPFISNAACRQYYPLSLMPDMICAGVPHHREAGIASSRDACTGDSGGPMTLIGDDDLVYQVGIVSFGDGEGCGSRKPGVYASVQYHYSWIQTTVCNATHVETSSDLCLMATLNTAPILSGRTTSLACDNLKQVGSTCSYGGECCSGVCSSSSFFYQRVCQEDAMATRLYRQNGSQRRLRSRRALRGKR